jgi:hypothetical protein
MIGQCRVEHPSSSRCASESPSEYVISDDEGGRLYRDNVTSEVSRVLRSRGIEQNLDIDIDSWCCGTCQRDNGCQKR